MAKPASKATVVITGGTLHFAQPGNYTIDYLPSGNVKIKVDGGSAFVMTAEQYAAITSFTFASGATISGDVAISGVAFTEASAAGPFEISHNLNALIGTMITTHGIAYTVEHLHINGSEADTFKTLWDYLDDAYVLGGNPFNVALNETFVRLGLEYVGYLEAGGEPLSFVTAKYAADNNANGIPQREQSMHDNLLGNLTDGAIMVRFEGALEAELLALVPDDYGARLLYEGLESQVSGARHDNVRAFDYDKGWDRPDYLDSNQDGLIDPLARNGSEMNYGDGNTVDDWNIVRHEGAQVELGLKVKHRGGDEYDEAYTDGDGVAHYVVAAGSQPGNPNRAEWNFDFSGTDYSPDDDFTYTLELDLDPGEGVQWVTLYSSAAPLDTSLGDGSIFQNSSNIAFYRNFIDSDAGTPGVQPYAFGEGIFNVRLSAFDADGGALVVAHEVIVHVEPLAPLPEISLL
jgi:hypothetical protein